MKRMDGRTDGHIYLWMEGYSLLDITASVDWLYHDSLWLACSMVRSRKREKARFREGKGREGMTSTTRLYRFFSFSLGRCDSIIIFIQVAYRYKVIIVTRTSIAPLSPSLGLY
ncbi:hypothetical protein CC2G_006766 [Coprinopsis cinerea AmutBmut pab1-1]|nr:hypothetical protein CC2G_006766 [Coprinopsis cinerea AmutBmut pab1-1]